MTRDTSSKTPVYRCTDTRHSSHDRICIPTNAEVAVLEERGFYQETYRELDKTTFKDWNIGVWTHRWWITRELPCALCGSREPSIAVKSVAVCLTCLNEFPNVPWHPTGAVRPRATALISHALNCTSHSSPPT